MSFSFPPLKRVALLAAVLAPVALTGCANMVTTAPSTNSFSPAATIAGNVHGGQQPVSGATVSLYAAGTTGYGSIPTLFATTTTSNDGNGSFAFTQLAVDPVNFPTGIHNASTPIYSCPATGNPQMYLVAKDGSSGGPATPINSSAAFIMALGPCSTAGSVYVSVNEVTTVATLAALQQYFNPALEGFGYNNTAQSALGFSNALGTIPNLVDTGGGFANTTRTLTGSGTTVNGATITVTPESSKINTIANILAACINTASQAGNVSTGCSTLFTNAVPPASSAATSQPGTTYLAATDTLQAAYYMLINPTDGGATALANLFNLGTGIVPFQPVLATAPSDWTIGITYGSNSQPNAPNFLLTDPEHVAIDAVGNVWLANFGTTAAGNSVTELSPNGTPITQVLTTVGGTNRNLAIDPAGNVWLPVSYLVVGTTATSGKGTTLYEYTTGGTTNIFTTGNDPASVGFDGVGNAFVIEPGFANTKTASGAASVGTLEEIPAGSANGTVATTIATNLDTDFSSVAVDSNYTIWVTGGNSTTSPTPTAGGDTVFQFLKNSGTGTGYPAAPTATGVGTALSGDTTVNGLTAPEALVINSNGDVLVDNFSPLDSIGGIAGTSTTTLVAAANTPFVTGTPAVVGPPAVPLSGLTSPQVLVVDGANNIWSAQATSIGNVFAFTSAGTPLAPTNGFVHTYKEPYGIAIDPSGNVWVGNENAVASGSAQGFVTEIVGAAVPVVTPIAAGLPAVAGGPNKLGTKP